MIFTIRVSYVAKFMITQPSFNIRIFNLIRLKYTSQDQPTLSMNNIYTKMVD
jgi:hypothetical protein